MADDEPQIVELTEDCLDVVAGGEGGMMDPNGANADNRHGIDPNG